MKKDHKDILKIGFIDSGVGCILFAKRLYETASLLQPMPDMEMVHIMDQKHIPYGTKPKDEIIALGQNLLSRGLEKCSNIFIACNTLSATSEHLAATGGSNGKIFSLIKKTSIEICKQAQAINKQNVNITILATDATISSNKYQEEIRLASKEHTNKTLNVTMHSMNDWVLAAEHYHENKDVNFDLMAENDIDNLIQTNESFRDANIVALCCTHYIIFSEIIVKSFAKIGREIKLIYQPDIFVEEFLSLIKKGCVTQSQALKITCITSSQETRYLSRFVESLYKDTPNTKHTIKSEEK